MALPADERQGRARAGRAHVRGNDGQLKDQVSAPAPSENVIQAPLKQLLSSANYGRRVADTTDRRLVGIYVNVIFHGKAMRVGNY